MPIRTKLISGDINALEKLYRLHFKKVFAIARKYTQDDFEADDVTQEVFIKLWTNKERVSKELPIEQQLFTITKNVVFNHLRKRVYRQKLRSEYKPNNESSADIEQTKKEKVKKIKTLVERLPRQQQEVFKMYRYQGLTYEEIATSLNIYKNTVSSHLQAAISFIRKNISALFFF